MMSSLALATLGLLRSKPTTTSGRRAAFDFVPASGVPFGGRHSRDPLEFKYYDPERVVLGKPMKEWCKFSVAYWHTWRGNGADPFGLQGTTQRTWAGDTLEAALERIDAHFELCEKLRVPYYCFHDRDVAHEGSNILATEELLDRCVERLLERQRDSGVRLLWGTANLFSHPRYMHGGPTSPDPLVVAHAGAQVKKSLELTHKLGGAGYVLWGGRDGYQCLLNTDLERELSHYAEFLRLVADHAREIGFQGQLWLEPKPREPMTHQYSFDAETTLGFLQRFGLQDDFALNVEANHATLAGHSAEHELAVAASRNKLGSIDVNRNEALLGWDSDMFPDDLALATFTMMHVVQQGGLPGGLNFDAKVRRESIDLEDLVVGHVAGMDTYARGLLAAAALIESGALADLRAARYAAFDAQQGAAPEALKFARGQSSLNELAAWANRLGEPAPTSGRQETFESIFRSYAFAEYD